MAGEDRADVAALEHLGEARLVAQLHRDREVEHARHRRVVHREDRAVRRRDGELLGEPVELGVADLAVVVAGHGRVEGDDAQAVDVVDAVDGRSRRRIAEQGATEGAAFVVVAHDPDDLRTEPAGRGVDDAADAVVRVGFAAVGEIAGEHDRLGAGARGLELGEERGEVRGGDPP